MMEQNESSQEPTSKVKENPSNSNNQLQPNSNEERLIWEIEVWKRAEQTKFKANLKQIEYEFLSKLHDDFKIKEEDREKEFKSKINEINLLQTRLRKKASELESRENKISLVEEELKLKINEVSRQLINKDDEISFIKKRFKEEKTLIEKDKLTLTKTIAQKQNEIDVLRAQFTQFKKEVDESPMSILKNELTRKSIENEEMIKDRNKIIAELDKSKEVNDKLKNDLIKMKKAFDAEKESMYKQKVDEIEKIKFEIYNQRMSQNDMNELKDLRMKIKAFGENGNNNMQQPNAIGNNSMNVGGGSCFYDNNNNNNFSGNNTQQIQPNQMGSIQKKEYKILSINRRARISEIEIKSEIDRLTKERCALLNGGMYSETDPLIVQYDIKIRKLLETSGY